MKKRYYVLEGEGLVFAPAYRLNMKSFLLCDLGKALSDYLPTFKFSVRGSCRVICRFVAYTWLQLKYAQKLDNRKVQTAKFHELVKYPVL